MLYDRHMQPNQQITTDNLQGGAQLQQQDTTTRYQQTGGVGQDALAPDQYQNLDNLSVQGTTNGSTDTAVTAGTNSPEAILLVTLLVVIAGMLVVRRLFFKAPVVALPKPIAESDGAVATQAEPKATKSKKKKSAKKPASKVKKPTKKAKKSSKK